MEEAPVSQADPAAEPSVFDELETIDNLQPWLKCLIYGDPGAGKTLFAASAPKPLILDCENSRRSIMDFPAIAARCKILRVKSFNALDRIFWELMNGRGPEIETVVIDTISELQRKNLDDIMFAAKAKDENRNMFLPFQGDYKISTESMRKMVTMFRDLPFHLIITAHRLEDVDQATGRRFVRPEVTPKLASTLKGVFDLQGFMTYSTVDAEGNDHFSNSLQVRQRAGVEAKCRLRYLPTHVENPNFGHLLEAHQKSLDEIERYKEEMALAEQGLTPTPEAPNLEEPAVPEPEVPDEAPAPSAMFTTPTSQD